MPQRRLVLHALAASPLARGSALRAQPATTDIGGILAQRVAQEGVGMVAFVASGAQVDLAAAGPLAAGGKEAVDADTRFEWGSITKTFTALLLADMVVRRELALGDAVEAVLPRGLKLRDSAGEPIRWGDLATQRSGLPRLPDNMKPAQASDPYADYDSAALEAFIAGWKPEVTRGTVYGYSNLGFGLLGHALGLRAGSSYEAALTTRVLTPLGLDGVRLRITGRTLPAVAQGHDAERRPVPAWQFQAMAGAGALVGSARELALYAQAALGVVETPLEAAFRLALSRQADGPGPDNPVGLAWLMGPLNGRTVANHDGGTYGFSSSLFLDPERRRASGVLANAFVGVTDVALHLLDSAVPLRNVAAERAAQKSAQERAGISLPAAELSALAGSYALSPQFKLVVRARDGRLFAQATGQGEFEIFAAEPRRFFAKVTPLEVLFEGDKGMPAALTLLQGGQRLRFARE